MASNHNNILKQKKMILDLNNLEKIEKVAYALDSNIRLKILSFLSKKSYTILELAEKLNISISNASFHIKLLKDANIINITHNPSKKGNEKIVALEKHNVEFFLTHDVAESSIINKQFKTELPVGAFMDFDISGPCGMADQNGELIGPEGNPDIFYSFERIKSEIIWFSKGYVEYPISNISFKGKKINSIEITLEVCSECANYNNNYKSDIFFEINGKNIGVYTSPGDFGGRRGNLTTKNWPLESTQYGKIVQIRIDNKGCFINQNLTNNSLTIEDFQNVATDKCMTMKLGINENSKYVGGINIFGKNFGDYNQGININILFD